MNSYVFRLKVQFRELLKKLGLLSAARFLKDYINSREQREIFLQFKRRYGDVLGYNLIGGSYKEKRVLFITTGWSLDGAILCLIKALETSGYTPVVLIKREHRHLLNYYKLAAIKEVIFSDEISISPNLSAAEAVLEHIRSIDELLTIEYAGARIGRFAASTAFRHLRLASLDLESVQDRRLLVKFVALSMAAADQAQRILNKVRPDLLLISDPVYTPDGELFDNCLARSVEVITIEAAHKSNALMLKRYTYQTRDEHFASISPESWKLLREMAWTDVQREQLQREIFGTYQRGDWYSVSWSAPLGNHLVGAEEIRNRVGLNPAKKTAFIFPHILWDASFSWGKSLFNSYEEWFIQTVKAACENDQVNWVIKIHPANVGKSLLDGFHGEPAEVTTLRKNVGSLPAHIFFIPANSEISTFSLFALMDYCITVRGTVGIEAASFGIPVLLAGTGRYDRRGFTIDSDSRLGYLNRLALIQEIPRLSPAQCELAERFAYGQFVVRPFLLNSVLIDNQKELKIEKGFKNIQININNKEGWYNAADFKKFTEWVKGANQTDFLTP